MLTSYLILTTTVTGVSLIWRTIKDDHPAFKAWVRGLPMVGESLSCGVCVSYWFSLIAVAIVNPITDWVPTLWHPLSPLSGMFVFIAGWITVGTGVLFTRSLTIVLLESAAILKHRHTTTHQNERP